MKRAVAWITALPIVLAAHAAHADCSFGRPTDPGGYAGEDYTGHTALEYDSPGGRLRLHWVDGGPAAPDLTQSAGNPAPDFIVLAAQLGDEAIAAYEADGFRPILADDGTGACASHGGDGRIDVYFIDFGAGDGQVLPEACAVKQGVSACSGFALVDRSMKAYGSDEIGLRTVLVHELFHLVQNAYNADFPTWFSEGTAQWAADRLHPALTDLEAFVPAYFAEAHRSIDNPPGGAAGGFLYGTAVWPVFLDEQFGPEVVRAVMDGLAQDQKIFDAIDAALAPHQSSVAAAFPRFAAWNTGTAERTGSGGYKDAAKYPLLPTTAIEAAVGSEVTGALAGLGIRAYALPAPAVKLALTLEADAARVGAVLVPLVDGKAQLDKLAELPAETDGPALLVVAGRTSAKSDAPFKVKLAEAPKTEPDPDPKPDPDDNDDNDAEGSCAATGTAAGASPLLMIAALALAGARRRRRTR